MEISEEIDKINATNKGTVYSDQIACNLRRTKQYINDILYMLECQEYVHVANHIDGNERVFLAPKGRLLLTDPEYMSNKGNGKSSKVLTNEDMYEDLKKEIRDTRRAVMQRLDQNQRTTIESVLNALVEGDQNQQFEELLNRLEAVVSELNQVSIDDAAMKSDLDTTTECLKDPELNIKNRLVCTIPRIPLLLTYQGIIEYQSGLNLLATWNKLTSSTPK